MKKLVLVAALFMFVCGGAFLAQARNGVQNTSANAALANDTTVTDTVSAPAGQAAQE